MEYGNIRIIGIPMHMLRNTSKNIKS